MSEVDKLLELLFVFAEEDEYGHLHRGKGPGGGQFQRKATRKKTAKRTVRKAGKPSYAPPTAQQVRESVRDARGILEIYSHRLEAVDVKRLHYREGRPHGSAALDDAIREHPEKVPPIVVRRMAGGRFEILEGHHRAHLYDLQGHRFVWAVVVNDHEPPAARATRKKERPKKLTDEIREKSLNRPSKPHERPLEHPEMPDLPWQPPPEPVGKKGTGPPRRYKGKRSNTAKGDFSENLTGLLGLRNIIREGKRAHSAKEKKRLGSSIDRELDHTGKFFEVKSCYTTATEYRNKAKPAETKGKHRFARIHEGEAFTLVPVIDLENKTAHVYWHEGLTYKKVPLGDDPNGWHYAGIYTWE